MKNSNDVIKEAQEIFKMLKSGEIGVSEANGLNNSIGMMVKMSKVKLEYNKFQGDHAKIEFLEGK